MADKADLRVSFMHYEVYLAFFALSDRVHVYSYSNNVRCFNPDASSRLQSAFYWYFPFRLVENFSSREIHFLHWSVRMRKMSATEALLCDSLEKF